MTCDHELRASCWHFARDVGSSERAAKFPIEKRYMKAVMLNEVNGFYSSLRFEDLMTFVFDKIF